MPPTREQTTRLQALEREAGVLSRAESLVTTYSEDQYAKHWEEFEK